MMGKWNIFDGKTQFLGFGKNVDAPSTEYVTPVILQNTYPVLPRGTMLKGRYRICESSMDCFFITYYAQDTLRNTAVTVVEYFFYCVSVRSEQDGVTVEHYHKEFQGGYAWFRKHIRYASQMPEGMMQILDTFEENGTIYVVLEEERGGPLRTELPELGCLWSPAELLSILDGAMNMVSRLHSAGFIHRWLGVDTIRIHDRKSTVDCFGNVGKYPDRNNDPDTDMLSSEPARRIFHRWEYPIEVFNMRKAIGPYSAVYVFAAILVRYLTQIEPATAIDRMTDGSGEIPDKNLSMPLKAVLEKGMAIRPKDRYQSIEEFRWALNCALEQE